jgi:hypothetical protein
MGTTHAWGGVGGASNTLNRIMTRVTVLALAVAAMLAAQASATPAHGAADRPSVGRHLISGILAGRITDAATGEPLPGARVALVGSRFGAVADAAGRYRVVAPAGVYDVEVTLGGYERGRYDGVEIAEDETARLDVELYAAGYRGADEIARPGR